MKRFVASIGTAIAALMQIGGGCGPVGPPPPDSCGSPKSKMFASLEVGPELLPMRDFEAWTSDDTAYITEGTQGGHMIAFALHMPGDAPSCISQKSSIKLNGKIIGEQNSTLNTYDAGDGTRITKTNYIVLDEDSVPTVGSQVIVSATAGGKTVSSTLTIATDRNKLESLSVITVSPHVGYPIDFQLKSRHAPPYSGFNVTATTSNVSVASASPPMYIYDDTETFQGSAYSPGTTTVTIKFLDQSVSAPVTVIP